MTSWNDIVIGSCLLLLAFLLWREWRRPDRSWLVVRVMASVVAVTALALMGVGLSEHRGAASSSAPRAGAAPAAGLVAADWQRRLMKGQRLAVQGRWKGPRVKIMLMGMGEVLDSAVPVGGEFALHTVPAQTGRAVYRLAALEGQDTLEQENIPVEVEAGRPLKVLVLAAAPGFEDRFLMSWLGAGGHAVAARIAVSKNKYQQTFVNMRSRRLDVLNSALLSEFDLVIADEEAVVGSVVLHRAVEAGLGLLIRIDSVGTTVPGWNIGGRGMVRDSLGRVVVRSGVSGAGRVVISAANMTYGQWMAGHRHEYAAYWTSLLEETARRPVEGEEWRWRPALPRVGDPVVAELGTDAVLPQGMVGDVTGRSAAVYLAEDGWLPWVWRGRYWPEKPGWQIAHTPSGDTTWWYAWPAGAWKGIYRETSAGRGVESVGGRRVESVGGRRVERVGGRRVVRTESVAAPKIWIYAVLLICMTFLWVERKISGMKG